LHQRLAEYTEDFAISARLKGELEEEHGSA
jgi:hypothetical protein